MSRAARHRGVFLALAAMLSGCSHPWDDLDPRLGGTGATGGGATAASTAASATSAAGQGGSGGGATSGGAGEQDCLDGADDDGDGRIDCADADCEAGFECVDEPPDGWGSLARIRETPFPARAAPPCPDGRAPAVRFAGPAGSADCTACACAWTGAACSAPELSCWFGVLDCTGVAALVVEGQDGLCIADPPAPPGDPGPGGSCAETAGASLLEPGGCAPSGGVLAGPALWAEEVHACALTQGGGCRAGQACVARGSGDFAGGACVSQAGSAECPSGWPTAVDTFGGATDTRACSACGCAADLAAVSCSNGSNTLYDLDACDDGSGHVVIDSPACVDATAYLDNLTASVLPSPAQPAGGTCAAAGGVPSGEVVPAAPVRFCCQ